MAEEPKAWYEHQPKRVAQLSWEQRAERRQLLDALLTMELMVARLRPVLEDARYLLTGSRFDWTRFAREQFPEVSAPALETWELFRWLRAGMPDKSEPPRRWLWWVIRTATQADDPDAWLLQQREQNRSVEDIAQELNNGVTVKQLYVYLVQCRKRTELVGEGTQR